MNAKLHLVLSFVHRNKSQRGGSFRVGTRGTSAKRSLKNCHGLMRVTNIYNPMEVQSHHERFVDGLPTNFRTDIFFVCLFGGVPVLASKKPNEVAFVTPTLEHQEAQCYASCCSDRYVMWIVF
jgi:hypothetical protein